MLLSQEECWWGRRAPGKAEQTQARPGPGVCSPALLGGGQCSFQDVPHNAGLNGHHADQEPLHPPDFSNPSSPPMVSDGLMGERGRQLSISGPHCTWGYKAALGPGQLTKLWLASSDPNATVSLVTGGGGKNRQTRDLQHHHSKCSRPPLLLQALG